VTGEEKAWGKRAGEAMASNFNALELLDSYG
jgi:hypothetical protein